MKRVNKDVKISNLALICALFSIGILIALILVVIIPYLAKLCGL